MFCTPVLFSASERGYILKKARARYSIEDESGVGIRIPILVFQFHLFDLYPVSILYNSSSSTLWGCVLYARHAESLFPGCNRQDDRKRREKSGLKGSVSVSTRGRVGFARVGGFIERIQMKIILSPVMNTCYLHIQNVGCESGEPTKEK